MTCVNYLSSKQDMKEKVSCVLNGHNHNPPLFLSGDQEHGSPAPPDIGRVEDNVCSTPVIERGPTIPIPDPSSFNLTLIPNLSATWSMFIPPLRLHIYQLVCPISNIFMSADLYDCLYYFVLHLLSYRLMYRLLFNKLICVDSDFYRFFLTLKQWRMVLTRTRIMKLKMIWVFNKYTNLTSWISL